MVLRACASLMRILSLRPPHQSPYLLWVVWRLPLSFSPDIPPPFSQLALDAQLAYCLPAATRPISMYDK
ncbi:uncharacterized [Tachysurus ichikawai]